MSDRSDRTVVSQVEVPLDPGAAFAVFTGEINLWWLRGPINNWDSARIVEMRCEQGVGGRIVEIYDEAAGEMLELARITTWEPGDCLAWQSSVDDVQIVVRFERIPTGSRVRLEATVQAGGRDAGGTSFVRVAPTWFGRWSANRDRVAHELRDGGRLAVAVYYDEPERAARWLRDAFGLEPTLDLPSEPQDEAWIEFRVGRSSLLVFKREAHEPVAAAPTHVPWVFVDDLDAHYATSSAAGATIIEPIQQHGFRAYVAADLEGHRWTFAQARPTM